MHTHTFTSHPECSPQLTSTSANPIWTINPGPEPPHASSLSLNPQTPPYSSEPKPLNAPSVLPTLTLKRPLEFPPTAPPVRLPRAVVTACSDLQAVINEAITTASTPIKDPATNATSPPPSTCRDVVVACTPENGGHLACDGSCGSDFNGDGAADVPCGPEFEPYSYLYFPSGPRGVLKRGAIDISITGNPAGCPDGRPVLTRGLNLGGSWLEALHLSR